MSKIGNVLLTGIGNLSDDYLVNIFLKLHPEVKEVYLCGSEIKVLKNYSNVTYILSPRNDKPEYLDFLLCICEIYQITDVVPCIDSETYFLSKNLKCFTAKGITPWVANINVIQNCTNKWACYQTVPELSPKSYLVNNAVDFNTAISNLGYPNFDVVCKPNSGPNGSGKGFRIITKNAKEWYSNFYDSIPSIYISEHTYSKYIEEAGKEDKLPDILVSEYLPGQEYSCYLCANNGEIVEIAIHIKNYYENGTTNTGQADVFFCKDVENVCKDLTKKFGLHLLNNIQLKRDTFGNLKLIEINPRLAGTILLSEISGYNLIQKSYCIVRNQKLPENKLKYNTSILRSQVNFFYQKSINNICVKKYTSSTNYTISNLKFLSPELLSEYDIFFFDLDNTLFSEWEYIFQCVKSYLDKINIRSIEQKKIIIDHLKNYYNSNGNHLLFDNSLIRNGCPATTVDLFLFELRNTSNAKIFLYELFEMLLLSLKNISKEIYIITDGNIQQQKNKVNLLQIERFVQKDRIIYADLYGGKRNIEVASFVKENIKKGNVCVFGDGDSDKIFAKNIKADFLKV